MKTLLAWPIGRGPPFQETGAKGLPVAMRARPSLQARMSQGVASTRLEGLESAKTTGSSETSAWSRMTSWSNEPGWPVVPMRTSGLHGLMTSHRRAWSSPSSVRPSSWTQLGRDGHLLLELVEVGAAAVDQAARVEQRQARVDLALA